MAKKDGGQRRRPIAPQEVARTVVADFYAAGIEVSADWEETDINGNELWHLYTFMFESGFSPGEVPALIEIARARIYAFGYRGLTSVKVIGSVGENANVIGIGEKTLTFTRNFNAAFSSVGDRMRQLKIRGSVRNEIIGFKIDVRAPGWAELDFRQRGKLDRKPLKPTRQRFTTPTRKKRKKRK